MSHLTDNDISNDIINNMEKCNISSNDSSSNSNSIDSDEEINNYNIYRYKFSENILVELNAFSRIHQYDDKKAFKDAWEEWISTNLSIIQREEARLQELGYKGCVKSKMYKSCRYYFSKKSGNKEKTERRKKYVMVNSNILSSMDKHIIENINKEYYKPANGYEGYCESNIDLLKEDIVEMVSLGMNVEDIKMKIKKTYKNRYFIISRNISKYKQLYESNSITEIE